MKIVKRISKIIGWFLLGVIILLLVVLAAIQTSPVKKQIVRIAENQVNALLNAEVSVGKLRGNFFNYIGLEDVALLSLDNDTIAYIPLLQLQYKLFPLLRGEIRIKEVVIDRPFIHIEQYNDSVWNVNNIVKPSADTSKFVFTMLVDMELVKLNEGSIRIDALDTRIPRQVRQLYIDLRGNYSSRNFEADLREIRFLTVDPDMAVEHLDLSLSGEQNSYILHHLLLKTAGNGITARGTYSPGNENRIQLSVQTSPLQLEEFAYYLPETFMLGAQPIVMLNAELQGDEITGDLELTDSLQNLGLQFVIHRLFSDLAGKTTIPVDYDIGLDIQNMDIGYWLNDPGLHYILNGSAKVKGQGMEPGSLSAMAEGNFDHTVLYGRRVNQLRFLLNYEAGNIGGIIEGDGGFGRVEAKPQIRQILGNRPEYHLVLRTEHFNLAPVLGNASYQTDLNTDARIQGRGFDLQHLEASGEITLRNSSFMDVEIDTLGTLLDYGNENLTIHSLWVESMAARLSAQGNISLKDQSDLHIQMHADSITPLVGLAGIEQIKGLEGRVNVTAHVHGKMDTLEVEAQIAAGHARYESYGLDSLTLTMKGEMEGGHIRAAGDLAAAGIMVNEFLIDSVSARIENNDNRFALEIEMENKDMRAELGGKANIGDTLDIALSHFKLLYQQYPLEMTGDTAFISIRPDEYEITELQIISPSIDSSQYIFVDGIVSRKNDQNLRIEIGNLNLPEIIRLFRPEQNITGWLDLYLQLTGSADSPILEGSLEVDDASIENYRFDIFSGNVHYRDKELGAEINIIPQDSGQLYVFGNIPAQMRVDSLQFDLVPNTDDSLSLQLFIEKLPLAVVNMLLPVDRSEGYIESDITVDGTLKTPSIVGDLYIVGGALDVDRYGIHYDNIVSTIFLETNKLTIDTFNIQTRRGNMTAKGDVQFDSEIYKGELNRSTLTILFDRFRPFDHRRFNTEISGDVRLNGNRDSIYFSGEVNIPETQVYLPAVMNLLGRQSTSSIPQPLLVRELEKETLPDTVSREPELTDSVADTRSMEYDFLKNLQGDLRIKIPRNMWIRNDDMRLELSGDVELLKHRDYFELFGSIDVVRGQYNLFGKVFVIQSGSVTFQGGEKINPIFSIDASYSFRDNQGNRRELDVAITGDLDAPELQFTMDDEAVSEGDALSYIIFGTNMDALTSGQQDNLTSGLNAADLASSAAASLISSQLTKILGNTLNVDYIEFRSTGAFDNASFVVGKYLTNKLFVSYEQHIGPIEDKDVARYEMRLEYELFRFLFLQLTSSSITNGADILFKFNSK